MNFSIQNLLEQKKASPSVVNNSVNSMNSAMVEFWPGQYYCWMNYLSLIRSFINNCMVKMKTNRSEDEPNTVKYKL